MSITKALLAAGLVTTAAPAIAAPFGFSVSDANATLYRIDLATGLAAPLGVINYADNNEIEGIASIDGELVGVTEADGIPGAVYSLIPPPGAPITGFFDRDGNEAGAAYDNTTDTLYNIQSDESVPQSWLYSIAIPSGVPTLLGTSAISADGLAIDSNGVAYASDFHLTDSLYTVDLGTGQFTLVGSFGLGDVDFDSGLAFDDLDQLYALTEDGSIYTIDSATGLATFQAFVTDASGARVPGDLEGLEIIVNQVPAPGSLALLGLGVVGLARRRLRA